MRREGYEFQVSPPRVLYQMIDGKKCEPIERLVVDVPTESVGAVIEKIGGRKGDLLEMNPIGARMKPPSSLSRAEALRLPQRVSDRYAR